MRTSQPIVEPPWADLQAILASTAVSLCRRRGHGGVAGAWRSAAILQVFLLLAVLSWSGHLAARDTRHLLPIDVALEQGRERGVLDPEIALHFGKGNLGGFAKSLGSDVANRKTNALNKTDVEACNWVFLSALRALQDGARKAGAKAVVEIVSFYKKREFTSSSEFECHAGAIIAGVALKGSYGR